MKMLNLVKKYGIEILAEEVDVHPAGKVANTY
jgi:hypothetical protein